MNYFFRFNFIILSVIPILLILSFNVGEIPLNDIIFPLIVSVTVAGIIFLIFKLKFGSNKAGLVISLFLITFLIFGNFQAYVNDILKIDSIFTSTTFLVITFLLISLLSIYMIIRKNFYNEFNKIFTVFSITLVIILLPNMLVFYSDESSYDSNSNLNIDLDIKMKDKPNVFLLIADEYGGTIQLDSDFNYFPKNFYDELEIRNFKIVHNGISNYPNTAFSVTSFLNMDYLDFIPKIVGEQSKSMLYTFDLRNDNLAMKIFKENGYKVFSYYAGMGAVGTSTNVDAKLCAPFNINNDLKKNYFEKFIPFTFLNNALLHNPMIEKLDCIENSIKSFDESGQPIFAMIQIRLPHDPYTFDSQGNVNEVLHSAGTPESKSAYFEQLLYSEKVFLDIIDNIQINNPNSVILFISDHGWREEIDWENRDNENTIRGHNVLIASFLPDSNYEFPERFSLVNLFRLLFNQYSNTEIELLDDRTIWYDPSKPNIHYDITEQLLPFIENYELKN